MNRIALRRFRWGAAVMLTVALLPGCKQVTVEQAPPPPTVTVSRPLQREVIRWDEYSGYLSSPKTVTVNARVSGLIEDAPFQEGAIVHAGDLLFKIDRRPFQADLDNKKAAVAQAKAMADRTNADYRRSVKLLDARVVAQSDFDTTKATYEGAVASLNAAEARAPITGRISRINVTVGNLVNGGSGQATALTTIVSIDPMYCYLNVPEGVALRYQELAVEQKQSNVAGAKVPCFLRLESQATFRQQGVIDFVDNQVDVNTGTVQIRAVFANPTTLLTPGLFARVRIPASGRYQALLIPDEAVNADQNERYLLIVGTGNVAQRRAVKLGALFGTLRSVTGGLKPEEWVIVSGMQWAMPGAKVTPREAPISTQALDELESMTTDSPTTKRLLGVRTAAQPDLQQSMEAPP
jgi:RND family efflux transporter MFP subunit